MTPFARATLAALSVCSAAMRSLITALCTRSTAVSVVIPLRLDDAAAPLPRRDRLPIITQARASLCQIQLHSITPGRGPMLSDETVHMLGLVEKSSYRSRQPGTRLQHGAAGAAPVACQPVARLGWSLSAVAAPLAVAWRHAHYRSRAVPLPTRAT